MALTRTKRDGEKRLSHLVLEAPKLKELHENPGGGWSVSGEGAVELRRIGWSLKRRS